MMHSTFGCGRRAATRPQDCPSDSTIILTRLWWRRAEIIAITTALRIGRYPLAILCDAVQMLLQALLRKDYLLWPRKPVEVEQ